ncbi:conserved domain protein, partial [Actinomyces sp. oral taxon 170 str. F0386]
RDRSQAVAPRFAWRILLPRATLHGISPGRSRQPSDRTRGPRHDRRRGAPSVRWPGWSVKVEAISVRLGGFFV